VFRQIYAVYLKCLFFLVFSLSLGISALAQSSSSAAINGTVQDKTGALISNATVRLISTTTGTESHTSTGKDGNFALPIVPPGQYTLQIERNGFDTTQLTGIVLNVGDSRSVVIHMKVGTTAQSVTVDGSGITLNTTDAAVGTVVDSKFVQDIPLNGRSFNSLIMLSPGVTSTSPQGNDDGSGFSTNGGRTSSNSFTLDGANAMNDAGTGGSGRGTTGSTASSTALGTTQSIISVDALQEFRITTSTYSAEFGRFSGAQVSFTSRAGTNSYHGTAFDYLRNYAFDANDWFNKYSNPPLPRPTERQNDFGGVFGGPLSIPKLFSGKNRAFFFFSYEGLRLQQPTYSTIVYVPSNGTFNTSTAYAKPAYKDLRDNAGTTAAAGSPGALNAPVLKYILNGFPLPNCSTAINPQCYDYGDGLSPFLYTTTAPSSINSLSARIDFQVMSWLHVFARYSDTESNSTALSYGSNMDTSEKRNRIFLLGADSTLGNSISNQLRVQYSPAYSVTKTTSTSVGGSQPVGNQQGTNFQTIQGLPAVGGKSAFEMYFPSISANSFAVPHLFYLSNGSRQFQPYASDALTWAYGKHLFKIGADYRQTTSRLGIPDISYGPLVYYNMELADNVLQNALYSVTSSNILRQDPRTKNLGVFVQDEWRVLPRLSLSLGVRYDFNPPPSISGAQQYTYTGSINNPSSLALSTLGAPLYKTTYTNFAPRLGAALTVHNQTGHETVLRAGGGLFFDTGQQSFIGTVGDGVSLGATNYQQLGSIYGVPEAFPLTSATILQPVSSAAPTSGIELQYVLAPDFTPPSTVQWSASLEQSFGTKQSVTINYVGSAGLKLPLFREYSLATLTKNTAAPAGLFSSITEYENGPGSNYNSAQVQYKRQMLHGLQVISSLTWAHAIDSASTDYSPNGFLPPMRGNSDHDIRENFSTALIYHLPLQYADRWKRQFLGNWDLDLTFIARTAFPVQPLGATVEDPVTGNEYPARLDWNHQNPYMYARGIPGGRQFNPAVFSTAASGATGTAPRNFLRGFGENTADVAVQRIFYLYRDVRLQFRAEAFNIANRPNFGKLNVSCGTSAALSPCTNPLLGQAITTLTSSIYGQGGPRSLQFALKLQF
jgi:hypothetical protein